MMNRNSSSDKKNFKLLAFRPDGNRGNSATKRANHSCDFAGLPELPCELRLWDGPWYLPEELKLARK